MNFLRDLFEFLPEPWRSLALPALAFVVVLAIALMVRRVLLARLHRWADGTVSRIDDVIVESLKGPTLLWAGIFAIHIATEVAPLTPEVLTRAQQLLIVLWILALTIALSNIAARLVRIWGARDGGAPRVGTLGEVLASALIIILGGLTLLRAFGIDITPALTALGVGGLAVALALQDTLSNLFAGFYLSLAQQIRVSDFIQLESGQRGYVTDIGWRSTTLRDPSNNLVVIPNNKLGQSIVSNFHLPEPRITVSVEVPAPFSVEPAKIERMLLDAAQPKDVPGLLDKPEPVARLTGFHERWMIFTLTAQVATYEGQAAAQDQLRRRILERYRAEGIEFPRIV